MAVKKEKGGRIQLYKNFIWYGLISYTLDEL